MNRILFLFFFLTFTFYFGLAQEPIAPADLQLIDYLFAGAKGDKPGANVLVIEKGEIIWQKSYGLAQVEAKIKSIPETNYRIASVAKQFTAMAIMILEHQGALSYETTLTEIFPDFPAYGAAINVRHLLTHQSGVIDYYEFIEEGRTAQMLDAEVLEGLQSIDSTYFPPGTQYQYSNSGYAVLALIVEKLSGKSFAEFMRQEIFEPLKMTDTQVFQLEVPIKNRAYGYTMENDSIVFKDQSVTSAIQGDGGIYSNVLDYLKWDQALYTDQLIPQEKLKNAFFDYDNNTQTDQEGYGYGWSIEHSNEIKILDHSGGTAGFETWVKRIPSLALSIVVFTNRDGHDRQLMHRINALTSIYSNYKIPMPLEIKMKQAIDQEGVAQGVATYDKLKENPAYYHDITTLIYLGFEYYRLQKFDEAKELFVKATTEHPNHFGGYYGLGLVHKKQENFALARTNFKKVIELGTPDDPSVLDRAKKHLEDVEGKK